MTSRHPGEPLAKWAYASGVRAIRRSLHRVGVDVTAPADPDRRGRHFARSLLALYDVEALISLGVPWWSYRAIDVVDAWLTGRGGRVRAFEYGSGASSLWLADRCSEVHSVEHDVEFASVVGPLAADRPNLHLAVVEPESGVPVRVASGRAGYKGLDFSRYVSQIDVVGGQFDLVVVDGRARPEALTASLPHLNPGGIVVFDNANRERHKRSIAASGLPVRILTGLTPTLPYPTTTALLGPARSEVLA